MAKKSAKAKNPPLQRPSREEVEGWVETQHSNHWAGERTPSFREHGKAAPGRATRASATMNAVRSGEIAKEQTAWNSPERAAAVREWQKQRPGGGSPSGATHQQWVSWGKSNPNLASNASRALGQARQFNK